MIILCHLLMLWCDIFEMELWHVSDNYRNDNLSIMDDLPKKSMEAIADWVPISTRDFFVFFLVWCWLLDVLLGRNAFWNKIENLILIYFFKKSISGLNFNYFLNILKHIFECQFNPKLFYQITNKKKTKCSNFTKKR